MAPDGGGAGGPPRRRRPHDRKAQILASACDLIVAHGSENVSMAMIADRVGITAGGLYRHFDNKAVLLASVCASAFDAVGLPVRRDSVEAMIEDAIARTAGGAAADLWRREVRHLDPERQRELRLRLRSWASAFVQPIRVRRPLLDQDQADLIAWSLQSLLADLGTTTIHRPAEERVAGVRSAAYAVLDADLLPVGPVVPEPVEPAEPLLAASMRERLLLAAIDRFGAIGYQETSMASIGAAVDVTGASLYGYFESKGDLLNAVLDRGAHAAWIAFDNALARAGSPEDGLRRALRAHIGLSRSWTGVPLPPSMDPEVTGRFGAARREYLHEWVVLTGRVAPETEPAELRLRVKLALGLGADLCRTPHLASRASFAPNLVTLAEAVLTA